MEIHPQPGNLYVFISTLLTTAATHCSLRLSTLPRIPSFVPPTSPRRLRPVPDQKRDNCILPFEASGIMEHLDTLSSFVEGAPPGEVSRAPVPGNPAPD